LGNLNLVEMYRVLADFSDARYGGEIIVAGFGYEHLHRQVGTWRILPIWTGNPCIDHAIWLQAGVSYVGKRSLLRVPTYDVDEALVRSDSEARTRLREGSCFFHEPGGIDPSFPMIAV
jgi:hypothetical protein